MQSPSIRFAESARVLAAACKRLGLSGPTFRSPPRSGRDRSIRRSRSGGATVAVRLSGRPFPAVQADMIEGIIAANKVKGDEAETLRRDLWNALASGGAVSGDPSLVAA